MGDQNSGPGRLSSVTFGNTVQLVGVVGTLIGVVVAVLFSIRAERTKALTVRYFAQRPLLSVEARPTKELEVIYGGERLRSPWLLSARLENSGNQPIESRDIEKPLEISFRDGRIVSAEIVGKREQAIASTLRHSTNAVTIEHGLLNPGDWVTFDILFDGQPHMMPHAALRISGVSDAEQVVTVPGETRAHLAVFPLPKPLLYVLLVIVSATALGAVLLGCAVIWSEVKDTRRRFLNRRAKPTVAEKTRKEEDRLADHLIADLTPDSQTSRIILAAIGSDPVEEWLDSPLVLRTAIEEKVPAAVFTALKLNTDEAAALLSRQLREALRNRLASLRIGFQEKPDAEPWPGSETFKQMDVRDISGREIVKRFRELRPWPERQEPIVKWGEWVAGGVVLVIGCALSLVVGGTWRTLLGF